MILFVGDKWLEKVSTIVAEFNPKAGVKFLSSRGKAELVKEQADTAELLVTSSGTDLIDGRSADLICPVLDIDGLMSLEVRGKYVRGAEYFPEELPVYNLTRLGMAALRGLIDFDCPGRFAASMEALRTQEETALPISDFIEDNYRTRALFSGSDRPDPVLTVEMARRIATALSLDVTDISQAEPWRTDHCAYRRSTGVILPHDAERMGLNFEPDPFWFPVMVQIINKLYGKGTDLDVGQIAPERQIVPEKARLMTFLKGRTVTREFQKLFAFNKAHDGEGAVQEIERINRNREKLDAVEINRLDMAMLRWYPVFGRGIEAFDHVLALNAGAISSPDLLRKLTNISVSNFDMPRISKLIELMDEADIQNDFCRQKLEKRRNLIESKAKSEARKRKKP